MYSLSDPFSVCFNILKLRYKDYDESLSSKGFLNQHDKINVFINLETVFKHLSMIPDLEKKLVLQRDFTTIMVSNILNLAAHYKRFFINNGFDTRVYLYHTDLTSDEFSQFKYNDDFRSYYLVKYNSNPKFVYLTDALKGSILPDVRTYCEFIPRVYYISAHNIEGSVVPYVVAKDDETRKNLIIGGDSYDTQYSMIPNFVNHYIHKGLGVNSVTSDCASYLKDLTKKPKEDILSMVPVMKNHGMYVSMLASMGDRIRSIDGIGGVGAITIQKLLTDGIKNNVIQATTNSPMILSDIFNDNQIKDDFVNNYYCTCITEIYEELTEADKLSLCNQRKDRLDINSLVSLNNTKFANHPLILEALTL